MRDIQTLDDIYKIVESSTGVGTILDELTLLRAALKAYCNGLDPDDAIAWASGQLSDIITKSKHHDKGE